ncbi:UDP-N-acetylmuramate dehydrogenase [Pontibacillus sp. ALD_SL1]|uniref:UDP-N-acetylmuramate dehydrogenase n=1 Tax=Pontibacillus sp. ALD_SL1 TaxID=2777185 RepID=UPI001F610DCB|nr:UDP-N-acetylmuramate dehydrogenase [Pontibacillus sp. ALD_SL1]
MSTHIPLSIKAPVAYNEPLSPYTFTRTGGHADVFVSPRSYEEAREAIRVACSMGMPFFVLGNGSNLIVRDSGIRGMVLYAGNLNKLERDGSFITAGSGTRLIDVSRFALENHLTGLEFACGIPGTIGGAVYMNAGAYGGEVKDVLDSVTVITRGGEIKTLSGLGLGLSYRSSIIEKEGYTVLEARFRLRDGDPERIQSRMEDLTLKRETKQPLEYPSCGSVFKRPPGYYAGKLIQDSGLSGYQIGGVRVSEKHAGFMVNVGGGTASDYIALIQHVQETVYQQFRVRLEREVRIIGE